MEQTIEYRGYKIEIEHDPDSESPDGWDAEDLFLVYQHRDFNAGRDDFHPQSVALHLSLSKTIKDYPELDVERLEEINDELSAIPDYSKDYYIFPVEDYTHSGVSLSLFSDRKRRMFDSSVMGFILASKVSFETIELAKNVAEGLVEIWNNYLSGNVYGYIIYENDPIYTISKKKFHQLLFETDLSDLETEFHEEDNFNEVDSCWGYYGDPERSGLLVDAKSVIDRLISNLNK